MRRPIRTRITYANVMATMAIFLALGGSAFAAAAIRANSITSAHVKDGTLQGVDVKDGSLNTVDLSAAARASFVGPRGDVGASGYKGLTGDTGPKGDTGSPGAPAEVVTSFASRDTGIVVRNNISPPNPSSHPWYEYNCGGANNDVGPCASDNGNISNAGVGDVPVLPSGSALIALSGINVNSDETSHTYQTSNNVTVPWSSNLTGTVSLTVLHMGSIHERIECRLQYANVALPNSFSALGTPQLLSAYGDHELVSMTLVGSNNVSSGTYNVRVVCSDIDNHGSVAWRFVRGNLTAMAARNA